MHARAASLGGNSLETFFGTSDSSADVFDSPVKFEGTMPEVAQPRHEDKQNKLAKKTDFAWIVGNIVTTLR
jgi:hypothetical protein